MKTTVNSKHLAGALSKLSAAIQAKATLPIMECVKIVVSGSKMTLYASNLDMQLSAVIECETKKNGDGECCARFSRLLSIANTSGGNIDIAHSANKMTLKGVSSNASIMTLDAAEWPVMDGVKDLPETEEVEGLVSALSAVEKAASEEKQRYIMCSVFFDEDSIVSTDGKRLHKSVIPVKVKCPVPVDVVRAVLKSKPTSLSISTTERLICFDAGDFQLIGKTIDGFYPAWRNVINEPGESFKINRDEVISVIDRVAPIGDVVHVKMGSNKFVATTRDGEEHATCETSAKGIFTGAFHCKTEYLLSSLRSCNEEVITIGMSKGVDAFSQIRLESGNDLMIIMQRRAADPTEEKSEEKSEESDK